MKMFGTKQLLFFWILFLLQSVILTQRQSADEMFKKKKDGLEAQRLPVISAAA